MTSEDWRLSGIAANVSTYVRDWTLQRLDRARHEQAADEGVLHGVRQEAADNEKKVASTERVQRVARWLLRKLDEAPDKMMPHRELFRRVNSRDYHALEPALQAAVGWGLIEWVNDAAAWRKL